MSFAAIVTDYQHDLTLETSYKRRLQLGVWWLSPFLALVIPPERNGAISF
jgi:hypothetical protein